MVLVALQIAAKKFHPFLYWATIVASTTFGTTMADFADRSLGIGYAGGSSLLLVCLLAALGLWYWSLGSISVDTVNTPKVEAFYWVAITFSQTLGTALGDWMADDTGLGYDGGALVFAAALALVAAPIIWTSVSRVMLFWAAFILTRPLGATVGDFLDKPVERRRARLQPSARLGGHRGFHHRLPARAAAARRTASGARRVKIMSARRDQAVQAGTTDVDAVRQAMIGQKVKSPSGFEVTMLPNHHMAKPVMIGEIQANGQFAIVYKSKALPPRAWSPYVVANKGKVADWSWPWACGGCTAPKYRTF